MIGNIAMNQPQAQWNTSAIEKAQPVKAVDTKAKASEEDAEQLRMQRDTLTNQITQLRGGADPAASQETVKGLEERLGVVNEKLGAMEGTPASPTARAFARLQGQTDTYEGTAASTSQSIRQANEKAAATPSITARATEEAEGTSSFISAATRESDAGSPDFVPAADATGKAAEESATQTTTADTDTTDREVQQLKSAVRELEEQLKTAQKDDPQSAKDIQRRLNLAKAEMEQKNSEDYRKQHANFFTGTTVV